MFFDKNMFHVKKDGVYSLDLIPERLRGECSFRHQGQEGKVIVEEGRRITARHVRDAGGSQGQRSWRSHASTCYGRVAGQRYRR